MKDYTKEIAVAEIETLKRNRISEKGEILVGRLKDGTRYVSSASIKNGRVRIHTVMVKKKNMKLIEKKWGVKIRKAK